LYLVFCAPFQNKTAPGRALDAPPRQSSKVRLRTKEAIDENGGGIAAVRHITDLYTGTLSKQTNPRHNNLR